MSRQKYPRLPDAVANLLVLHGLRATITKDRQWINGARLGWVFNVYVDKPAVHLKPVFSIKANEELDEWVRLVRMYTEGAKEPFDVDFETIEKRILSWTNTAAPSSFDPKRYRK